MSTKRRKKPSKLRTVPISPLDALCAGVLIGVAVGGVKSATKEKRSPIGFDDRDHVAAMDKIAQILGFTVHRREDTMRK